MTTSSLSLDLRLDHDGHLWLHPAGGDAVRVQAKPCFPWSAPSTEISIRNLEGEELAFVRNPAELDAGSRGALETAVSQAGFVLEIEEIESVEPQFELRIWKVKTRQGPRQFQTKLDDWPREVPGGGLMIRDVAGDLYIVRTPGKLDAHSRKLLWAFVD